MHCVKGMPHELVSAECLVTSCMPQEYPDLLQIALTTLTPCSRDFRYRHSQVVHSACLKWMGILWICRPPLPRASLLHRVAFLHRSFNRLYLDLTFLGT